MQLIIKKTLDYEHVRI